MKAREGMNLEEIRALLFPCLVAESPDLVQIRRRDPRLRQGDREVAGAFEPKVDPERKPLPEDRKQKQRQRKRKSGHPGFDMRTEAYKLFG